MSATLRVPPLAPGSILGLNYNGGHDSSVSVVAPDGSITFACSLERVTRRKQDGRFPRALLDLIDFDQIIACALPSYSQHNAPTGPTGQRFHSLRHSEENYPIHSFPSSFYADIATVPVRKFFVGHELAHAASGYYLSQFGDSAILSYDAGMYNEPWFGGVFHGSGPDIRVVDYFASQTNAKIASLYAVVTGLLGYKPLRHEGKLTGLAAYAEPSPECMAVLDSLLEERYRDLESVTHWVNAFATDEPPQFVVDTRARDDILGLFSGASPATIAASLQRLTEQHVLEIVARIKDEHLSGQLCLAGGLFANVRLNQRIHELWGGDVFVAPPMGDDGAGLGAALYHAYQTGSAVFPAPRTSMYLGFSYSDEDLESGLRERTIEYDKPDRPAAAIASLLANGRCVGIFMGPMEFGPRALGHRTILAPATDRSINETLNRKLRRTEFMPFAPITRREDATQLYEGLGGAEHSAEYMTMTFNATRELADSCPAVVHVDGSVRPQLVDESTNPFLHEVLTEYRRLTGLSAVINTSFNIHEEPIVCTPDDALRGFLLGRLDYLYMEGLLVPLKRNLHLFLEDPVERFGGLLEERHDEPVLVEHLWRELHNVRNEAGERLALVEQLHAQCEQYRVHIDGQSAEIEQLRAAAEQNARTLTGGNVAASHASVPTAGAARDETSEMPLVLEALGRLEARVNVLVEERAADVLQGKSGDTALVLDAVRRLETRFDDLIEERAPATANVAEGDRILALTYARQQAEDTAEARLLVIREQERALEHYRYWRLRERLARLLQPRIGVLYQYDPRKMEIPPRYFKVNKLVPTSTISIVTPSYNQGRFIERTLNSVFGQNYPCLEYVVQDGASTDDTLEVLERFQTSMTHVESARDDGLANALNLGFARTSGDVMAYLNSDDILLPGTLHYVANYFAAHPHVDVVYGHRIIVDEYDQEIGRWVLPPHDDEVLSWADYVPQETLFWRRSLWERVGASVDETFKFAVDWDLLIRFRDAGATMQRLPRFMGAFRVHPHQKTSAQMADVGASEMGRLRERCQGRPVSATEIGRNLRGYLRQHVIYHKLYRLGILRY